MDASTAVALVSTGVATVIAVVVPWLAFRLALRQDQTRWLREQRTQVYVDLLTEAYAEQQWLEYDRASEDVRAHMRPHFEDLRLPPLERARLGVRATMFGSRTVNQLFNRLPAEAFWSSVKVEMNEGDRQYLRMRIGRIMDELQTVIRKEMETDRLLPQASSNLLKQPHPAQREAMRQMREAEGVDGQ